MHLVTKIFTQKINNCLDNLNLCWQSIWWSDKKFMTYKESSLSRKRVESINQVKFAGRFSKVSHYYENQLLPMSENWKSFADKGKVFGTLLRKYLVLSTISCQKQLKWMRTDSIYRHHASFRLLPNRQLHVQS